MNKIISLALSVFVSATFAFAACEKGADPCAPKKELDAWNKSFSFGLNKTSGNSSTLLATAQVAANRETAADLIDFASSFSYGEDDALKASQGDSVSRNDVRATAGYNYKLSERMYAGLGSKVLHDQIADVNYRLNLNPTLGYFLVKDADFTFGLEGGPGYTFEKVGGIKDDYFSPRLGDRFEWIISCTSKLFQTAEVLFDIDDSENYQVNAEAGIEAAINSSLSLVLSVRENYDHLPAAGRDKGDFALLTALKVAL